MLPFLFRNSSVNSSLNKPFKPTGLTDMISVSGYCNWANSFIFLQPNSQTCNSSSFVACFSISSEKCPLTEQSHPTKYILLKLQYSKNCITISGIVPWHIKNSEDKSTAQLQYGIIVPMLLSKHTEWA